MVSTECEDDVRSGDFFDTKVYQRICDLYGGEDSVQDDIFLEFSTHGFQAFKNKSYDSWPLAAIVWNLAPHLRFSFNNVLPFAFVSRPSEPSDLQSFMEPLLKEIENLNANGGCMFQIYHGVLRKVRVAILWVTGDLPAVKTLFGVKGPNGKLPCRFCKIEGIWCPAHRHNCYTITVRDGGNVSERYDVAFLPLCTIEESTVTIEKTSSSFGQQEAELQVSAGIPEGSNLFQLPNILPYVFFPIDVTHLFYNISMDMSRLWCSDGGDDYVLGRAAMRDVDAELRKFGDGIAGEVGARPRPITRFKDWTYAELKDFALRYSLIVLDGYQPQTYLSRWAQFVELVDLCWRPVLTEEDISEVGRLAPDFYRHYEEKNRSMT